MKYFAFMLLAIVQFFHADARAFENELVAQMRTNLYISEKDKTPVLIDGTLTQYHSTYSNDLDGKDARKMSNFSENWGMLRGNTTYVIERRSKIIGTDTIFFKMWNMRVIRYEIEFDPTNFTSSGHMAVLEDKYLRTSATINLTKKTTINFEVTNDPASMASDRFRLIYKMRPMFAVLPVTFIKADAQLVNAAVDIRWETANESEMKNYEIEKSQDGNRFATVASVPAGNQPANRYMWTEMANGSQNFYRIKSTGANGYFSYSKVMRVEGTGAPANISVYPNPVTTETLQLRLTGKQNGTFDIRLMNALGRTILTKTVEYRGGIQLEKIQLPSIIPAGIYRLEAIHDGERTVISVLMK